MNADGRRLVVAALKSVCVALRVELDLQDGIESAFRAAGITFGREVPVSGGIIDFTVGQIGVEVKTRGGVLAVARQLQRYAHTPQISELVVATTRPALAGLPGSVGGKPVTVVVMKGSAW